MKVLVVQEASTLPACRRVLNAASQLVFQVAAPQPVFPGGRVKRITFTRCAPSLCCTKQTVQGGCDYLHPLLARNSGTVLQVQGWRRMAC